MKTAIPRPFTRTRQKGYYFSVIRCWRKRSAEGMSVPMQNRSKILPKTIIIIMKKKKKTFLFFEIVVRIRCLVKLELTVFAGKNAPSSIKLIERAGAGDYLRHLLAVSSRHQHLTVV